MLVAATVLESISLALLVTVPGVQAQSLYVSNSEASSISVIDTATNAVVGSPITVGLGPRGIAITPGGSKAYVANTGTDGISVIDTKANATVGSPIPTGIGAEFVAITPDGRHAYVSNPSSEGSVSVIDTATDSTVGVPIPVGDYPGGIAITPDGSRAYVTNQLAGTVSVIDTATNTLTGAPIPVGGTNPFGIAITPDGTRAYVSNTGSESVSVIDTATNAVVGSPITVEHLPGLMGITPDGSRVYVSNNGSATVSVIDIATNQTVGEPIAVGNSPNQVAISPDGSRAYVANFNSDNVSVINTNTNKSFASIPVGKNPIGAALVPDQPPQTSLTGAVTRNVARLDGGASTDPDGAVSTYAWDFGDGSGITGSASSTTHTYRAGHMFTARVTTTDDQGCSTRLVFTGQTATCNGSAVANASVLLGTLGFGRLKHNSRRGTAKLAVRVPGPGTLKVSGKGLVRHNASEVSPSTLRLPIKVKGKFRRRLRRTGRARVSLRFLFTPDGGISTRATRRVELLQRITRRRSGTAGAGR
jgi:YVTN family beta-propeller protein